MRRNRPDTCGVICFTQSALRLPFPAPVEQASQLLQIIDAKGRTAVRNELEGICRDHIRQIGQQGPQLATAVVVENPILAPVQPSGNQFVLSTPEWMERMGDPESACSLART